MSPRISTKTGRKRRRERQRLAEMRDRRVRRSRATDHAWTVCRTTLWNVQVEGLESARERDPGRVGSAEAGLRQDEGSLSVG